MPWAYSARTTDLRCLHDVGFTPNSSRIYDHRERSKRAKQRHLAPQKDSLSASNHHEVGHRPADWGGLCNTAARMTLSGGGGSNGNRNKAVHLRTRRHSNRMAARIAQGQMKEGTPRRMPIPS